MTDSEVAKTCGAPGAPRSMNAFGNVYVGAAMSDKSELPFENHGSSLLSPLLSLIVAPT
jgi:hypothetical protein